MVQIGMKFNRTAWQVKWTGLCRTFMISKSDRWFNGWSTFPLTNPLQGSCRDFSRSTHVNFSLISFFRICKWRGGGSLILSKDFIRQGSNIPNNTIPAVASYEKCRRRDQIFPSLVWMSALGGIQPLLKQTKSHRGLENNSRGSLITTTNIKYPIMRSLSSEYQSR